MCTNIRDVPRHKTDQERGFYGVWLRRGREKLGWTQKEVVAYLKSRGLMSGEYIEAYYRGVEAGPGKKFGPDVHDALVDLFGFGPEPLPDPPASDDAVVAAIDRQTDALVAALDRVAAALRGDGLVREDAVKSLLRGLLSEGLLVRPSPLDTAPSTVGHPPGSPRP